MTTEIKMPTPINFTDNAVNKVKELIDQSSLSLKKSLAFIHSTDEKANSPYSANGQVMEGRVEGRMVSMDV